MFILLLVNFNLDLICELLGVNRTVSKMLAFLSFLKEND